MLALRTHLKSIREAWLRNRLKSIREAWLRSAGFQPARIRDRSILMRSPYVKRQGDRIGVRSDTAGYAVAQRLQSADSMRGRRGRRRSQPRVVEIPRT